MANTRKSIEIDSWDANVSGLKLTNLTSSTPDKTTGTTFKSVLVDEDGQLVVWPENSGWNPDLQAVLDQWTVATDWTYSIVLNPSAGIGYAENSTWLWIIIWPSGEIQYFDGVNSSRVYFDAITNNRTITFPDDDGTVALLWDIPDISGKENTSNKATDLTSPDNTKYPTTQAVATAIAAITSTTPGGVNWSIQYKNGSAFNGNSLATITELDSVLELILWGTASDEQGWLRLKWYRWPTSAQNVLLQANQATNNVSSDGSYTVELPNHAGKIVAHTGFITKTASTTADITMENRRVCMNVATANTFTVPSSSVPFSIGAQIDVAQYWAGKTTIVAGSGVTIRSEWGKMKIAAQYVGVTLIKMDENEWLLVWNLST